MSFDNTNLHEQTASVLNPDAQLKHLLTRVLQLLQFSAQAKMCEK